MRRISTLAAGFAAALALTAPPIVSALGYPFTAAGVALVLTLSAFALFERARLAQQPAPPAPPRTPDRTISIAVEVETERAREALARLADEAEDLAQRAEAAVHRAEAAVCRASAFAAGAQSTPLEGAAKVQRETAELLAADARATHERARIAADAAVEAEAEPAAWTDLARRGEIAVARAIAEREAADRAKRTLDEHARIAAESIAAVEAEAARGGVWAVALDAFEDEEDAREIADGLPGAFVARVPDPAEDMIRAVAQQQGAELVKVTRTPNGLDIVLRVLGREVRTFVAAPLADLREVVTAQCAELFHEAVAGACAPGVKARVILPFATGGGIVELAAGGRVLEVNGNADELLQRVAEASARLPAV